MFLKKRILVAEGLRMSVTRHFIYSDFAVKWHRDNVTQLSIFVVEGKPGTGFFMRSSDSQSYRQFVAASQRKNKQNFFTLLLRKEPDFDKEYELARKAYETAKNDQERRILSCYQNVVTLARDEEQLQRVVRAVKDKMKDRPTKRYLSILSHYKSSINRLERDAHEAQINYAKDMDETQLRLWGKVVDAFQLLTESRRVWAVFIDQGENSYKQVFFDMGVFDYIKSPGETPVMRDQEGRHYYLYPDGLVASRSSVDFDFHPWASMEVKFGVVDISMLAVRPQFNTRRSSKHRHKGTDAMSTLYGASHSQVVGEIYFPKLDLRFYVNRTGPAEDFVKALNEWKSQL